MIDHVLFTLHTLRDASRRSTLTCTMALAAGVIMVPLSYRGGVEPLDRWLLLAAVLLYVAVAAYRVSRGLDLEKQLETEERYVHLVERDGISAPAKIGRQSTLVQAIHQAGMAEPGDRRRTLRGALRRSTRRLRVPAVTAALPALIVLGGLWIRLALRYSSERNLPLFVIVIVLLAALLTCEGWLVTVRRRVRRDVAELIDHVVEWWTRSQAAESGSRYRHQVLYRDVAERLGLT